MVLFIMFAPIFGPFKLDVMEIETNVLNMVSKCSKKLWIINPKSWKQENFHQMGAITLTWAKVVTINV